MTQLQMSRNDEEGNSVYNFILESISTNSVGIGGIKGHILMHKKGDTTTFLMYSITAAVYIPGSTLLVTNNAKC